MIQYLRGTRTLILTLQANDDGIVRWWIDASYAVHEDMKGHTGATLSLGKGGIYSGSWKQKLVARSSTESELIGVYDVCLRYCGRNNFWRNRGGRIQPLSSTKTIPAQSYWKETGEIRVRNEQNTWTLGISMLPNKLEGRLFMSLIVPPRKW